MHLPVGIGEHHYLILFAADEVGGDDRTRTWGHENTVVRLGHGSCLIGHKAQKERGVI